MQEYARYRICKTFLSQKDHSQLSKSCGLKKEVDIFFGKDLNQNLYILKEHQGMDILLQI